MYYAILWIKCLSIFLCGLTILIVNYSVFCSESNEFGTGLLLGTSKSKISNINEIKPEYNNEYIDIIKCLNTEFNGVLQIYYKIRFYV